MAAYCDFNEINGGKVVPFTYKKCQQTVIFITNYKYEKHEANTSDIYTSVSYYWQ